MDSFVILGKFLTFISEINWDTNLGGGGGMNNITLSFPFSDQVCLNLFKAVTLYCNIVAPWQYVGPLPLPPLDYPH